MVMRTALRAAPLVVLASMIWLAPGCGDDDSDVDSEGSAGMNVMGGATGEGGEPVSSSGGSGATGTGATGTAEGGASEGGTPGTGEGGTGEGGASEGSAASGAGGAPPPDCLGDPLPTIVPDNVVISGRVTTWGGVIIDLALVEGRAASDDELLDDDTSAGNGGYELAVPTGGAPLDAYLHVSADGSVDSYVYPPIPFVADDQPDLLLITTALRTGVADEADVSLEAATGLLYVRVLDCDGDPVQGATVTTDPPGVLSYTEGFVPSPDATSTDATGAAYIFNLPPGDVEVDATIDGYSLREHTIEVRADVMTITSVIP